MMEQVLFVDACMRGDVSRTRTLCQAFLAQYTALRPQCQVLHRDLTGASLPVLTGPLTQQRDQWVREGEDSPLLAPAREVAGADLILIGAPYWDLTFPAALKVYLEWSSTLGLTFAYMPEGEQVGLSRARHLVFVTTAGGPIGTLNLGYDYLKAWGAMVGISYNSVKARIPQGDWGTPDVFKGVAVLLASEAGRYINGATIPVDGGYLTK